MEINIEELSNANEIRICVVGVGGGGCNTINHIVKHGVNPGIRLIAMNTDAQHLKTITAHSKIQLGEKTARGMGVGMQPARGKESAEESYETIKEALKDSHIVFIATGLGGGTGTGATPVVARAAREVGALVISVVTKPFAAEGKKREKQADAGLKELRKEVDTIIVIPNEKLNSIIDQTLGLSESLKIVDDVMSQAVRGIASFIVDDSNGGLNIDYADLETIMTYKGLGLIGIGEKEGEDAAIEAVKEALESPLLDNVSIRGAKGAIVHYSINRAYPGREIQEANAIVQQQLDEDADSKFGWSYDDSLAPNQVKATLVITGFEKEMVQADENQAVAAQRPIAVGENPRPFIPTRNGGNDSYNEGYPEDYPIFMRNQVD